MCVFSHISALSSLILVSFITRLLGVAAAVSASSSFLFCSFRGRFLSHTRDNIRHTESWIRHSLTACISLFSHMRAEEFQNLMKIFGKHLTDENHLNLNIK